MKKFKVECSYLLFVYYFFLYVSLLFTLHKLLCITCLFPLGISIKLAISTRLKLDPNSGKFVGPILEARGNAFDAYCPIRSKKVAHVKLP